MDLKISSGLTNAHSSFKPTSAFTVTKEAKLQSPNPGKTDVLHFMMVMKYCQLFMCVDVYVPRAKHPVKVHIWAGISLSSSTGICIFSGIMQV